MQTIDLSYRLVPRAINRFFDLDHVYHYYTDRKRSGLSFNYASNPKYLQRMHWSIL